VERIAFEVPTVVADALRTLAWREDRDPRRQAVRLLRAGLIEAGVLPEGKTADDQAARAVPAHQRSTTPSRRHVPNVRDEPACRGPGQLLDDDSQPRAVTFGHVVLGVERAGRRG